MNVTQVVKVTQVVNVNQVVNVTQVVALFINGASLLFVLFFFVGSLVHF